MDYPNLTGKSILITGGTGSFSRAFVKQILSWPSKPSRLIIFSRGEHLQEEMARQFNDPCMRYFIGDVRDQARLEMAMRGVDIVIHAAALKIVPIAEYNPIEAINTNIIGSNNVITAAIKAGVKQVIALSTDKAVNPINLYGATKLAAEKLFVAANNLSAGKTTFSVVRYGNVVGSRGSVIPLFKKQYAEKGELTLTHKDMTRFWITLPQAVDFVLSCLENSKGREIFIPRIPAMRILDIANYFGVKVRVIGIRPGEKIHEVLLTEDESMYAQEKEDRFIIYPTIQHDQFFSYSSNKPDRWIDIRELKILVDNAETA